MSLPEEKSEGTSCARLLAPTSPALAEMKHAATAAKQIQSWDMRGLSAKRKLGRRRPNHRTRGTRNMALGRCHHRPLDFLSSPLDNEGGSKGRVRGENERSGEETVKK
jgi:hypothetical protein